MAEEVVMKSREKLPKIEGMVLGQLLRTCHQLVIQEFLRDFAEALRGQGSALSVSSARHREDARKLSESLEGQLMRRPN